MSNAKSIRRALMTRIETLTAELATCTTAAMRRCVQESLDDARRQLREGSGELNPGGALAALGAAGGAS